MATAEITTDFELDKDVKAVLSADTSVRHADATNMDMTKDQVSAFVDSTVDRIAGMIVDAYTTEGDRNFAIGAEAHAYVLWQSRRPGIKYTPKDHDNALNSIKQKVRLIVLISEASIRINDWVLAYVSRLLARLVLGEHADRLSYHEWAFLSRDDKESKTPRALTYDKKTATGVLNDGWIDFVRDVAERRAAGESIGPDEFEESVKAKGMELAALKAASDPTAAALAASQAALRARSARVSKVNKAVSDSVTEAIGEGIMTADTITSTVASVCKALKQPAPKMVGLDPATATAEDLKMFVKVMVQFKRWDEIRSLASVLTKVIEASERINAASADQNSTLKIKVG